MKLHRHPYIITLIRCVAFILSLIFVIYGVAIFFASPSLYLITFASIIISYGVGIVVLLLKTHPQLIKEEQINILLKVNTTLSILLPLAWLIGCLDTGIISGQEILSVLLVAFCSAIVWFGVSVNIFNEKKRA